MTKIISARIFNNLRQRGLIPPRDGQYETKRLKEIAIRLNQLTEEMGRLDVEVIALSDSYVHWSGESD